MGSTPTAQYLERRLRVVEREIEDKAGPLVRERDLIKETLSKYSENTNGSAPKRAPVLLEAKSAPGMVRRVGPRAQEEILEVILNADDPVSVRTITALSTLSQSTVSAGVQILEADDLIERTTPAEWSKNNLYVPAGKKEA